jgi:hypothetical protein
MTAFRPGTSARESLRASVFFRHTLTLSSTPGDQDHFPLLQLPAELRNRIYESAARTITMCHGYGYTKYFAYSTCQGSIFCEPFALLYTCQQVYHEARGFYAKLPTFDLSDLSIANYSVKALDLERCASIQTIRISIVEALVATGWVNRGAVNSEGDKYHYALDIFPSLVRLEVDESKDYSDWDGNFLEMRDALRYCFAVPDLEVQVSLYW